MSRTVETNVVEMQFDNRNFEKNVNQTVKSIDKLKDSLTLGSNTTNSLSSALSSIDMSKVVSGIETLSDRFSAMGIAGMTVIQRLTNAAIDLGLTLERKVVGVFGAAWNQIITGGTSRASNIEKATFQLKGIFGEETEGQIKLQMAMTGTSEQIRELTGLTEDLIVAENAANYAVADTAFGLDSAAKAASVLATSGVDVVKFYDELADESGRARTEMQVALRAISGTAAMANVSYDEMAHIFERVSGQNRVMGQDLESLSSRGLNAAAVLADYMNEVGLTVNATQADIKKMVSKGEIDFMTFAKAMDDAYGEHAKDANSTFSGAFDNMRFALSKIGADFIAPLREDMIPILNDVRMAINAVRASLGPFTDAFKNTSHYLTDKLADKFKNLIGFGDSDSAWKESEGWNNAIEKLTNIVSKATDILFNFWDLLDSIVGPIRRARQEILPANGYSGITTFLDTVNNLIKGMTLSAESMEKVNRVAKGFFSIFKMIGQIISTVVGSVKDLVKGFSGVDTTFDDTVVSIADFLTELADSGKVIEYTTKAVEILSSVTTVLIGVLKRGYSAVSEFGSHFVAKFRQIKEILGEKFKMPALTDINFNLDNIKAKLEPVKNYLEKFKDVVIFIGTKIVGVVKTIFVAVKNFVVRIFEEIKSLFTDVPSFKKYENAFDLSFITILFANVMNYIRMISQHFGPISKFRAQWEAIFGDEKVWETLKKFIIDGRRAILGLPDLIINIKSVFGNLNTAIKHSANMAMFKAVALALVAFTASVYILSKIDADKAIAGIIAVAIIVKYLKNVMLEFNAFDANIENIAGASRAVRSLAVMSVSVLLLASAMSKITKAFNMNPTGAMFALVSIYVLMEMMMRVIKLMMKGSLLEVNPKGVSKFAAVIISFGIAMKLMGSAMMTITKAFDKNWQGALFALVSMYALVQMMTRVIIQFQKGALLQANPKGVAKLGFAMIEIAASMVLLAVAIRIISKAYAGDNLVPGLMALGTVAGLMIGVVYVIKSLSEACGRSLSGMMGMQVATTALISVAASLAILGLTIAGLAKSYSNNPGATIAAVSTVLLMMFAMVALLQKFNPEKALVNGLALIEFALALSIIGRAIGRLSKVMAEDPLAGVEAMAAIVVTMLAMSAMLMGLNPKKAIANALAMVLFANALALIAIAVRTIGGMGLKNALVGVGSLIALLVAFVAVAKLAELSALGIAALTAAIVAIGLAFLAAGAGMALFGVGVMAIAAGITALSASLAIGLPVLVQGITATLTAIAMMIPTIASGLAQGLLVFIEIILDHVDVIINLVSTIVMSVVQSLTTMIPQIATMLVTLLLAVLDLVATNIGPVTDKLISIFVNFLNAVSARLPEINAALTDFFSPILEYIVGIISGVLSILAEGIGEIFGSFIGSLVNGIAKTLDRESLVSFADTLAEFMLHLQPFIDGLKGLDESTARAALMLAAMITILTADDIIHSLSSWFTGGNSMAKFGEDLASFGPYIKQYADDVRGIDVNAVEASTRAAQMIADFARTIPNEGGLLGKIFGENDIASFGAKLREFGPHIRQYSDDVQGIDVEAVEASTNAAKMISDFAHTIPNEGGLVAAITGDNDIETFGKQLKSFGKHIADYAEEVNGLDSSTVEASVSAARMLTEFANTIPNSGGLKAIFEGDNSVDKFGKDLATFGLYIKNYYDSISHVDSDLMLDTTDSLIGLLDILNAANNIPSTAVDNLQNLLGKVAELGLEGFYDALAIDSAEDTRKAIDKFFKTISDGFKENAETFEESATASGENVGKQYASGIKSEYSKSLVRAAATELANESVRALGDAIGDDPIEEEEATLFNQPGINAVLGYGGGMEEAAPDLYDTINSIADKGVLESDKTDEYYNQGYNNLISYNNGMAAASKSSNFIAQFTSEKDYLAYAAKQDQKPVSRQHEGYISPNYIYDSEEEAESYQLAGSAARNYTRATDEATDSAEDHAAAYQALAEAADKATASNNSAAASSTKSSSASKQAKTELEKLQDKIDDVMEDYEKRLDTARKNASKDLFKGVEVQGKNFLDEISNIMKEYEKIYTNAVDRTNSQDLFAEVNDENESFAPETLLNNLEDQVNQVNEFNTIIASISGRITDNNLRAAIANMDVDDLPQLRAMYRMTSSQLGEYEKMYQEKVLANQNKIQNELSGNLSQLTGEYTNVASYVASDGITNVMLNNMQLQIDKVNEYNDTINSLMSRVTDMNLREAIATMGIDSLDELKRLNSMTDAQLDQYVAMYNQKVVQETTSIEHELSAKLSALLDTPLEVSTFYEAYKAGMIKISDFVKADESGSKAAGKAAGQTIAEGVNEGVKESYSEQEAYENGKNYTEALARGMADQTAIVFLETTVDGVISMIIEALQNSYPEYKEGGIQVVTNLLTGINESLDAGFDETIDGITSRILLTFEECNDDYVQSGHDLINAFCQGIEEGMNPEQGFEGVIDSIIGTILQTFRESYELDFPQVGHDMVHYLCEGIEDAKDQGFEETIDDMVNIILMTLSIEDTYEDYYECGHTIVHEFCEGIDNALDSGFEGTIKNIVTRIQKIFSDQENIIIRIGEFIDYGLAKGMRSEKAMSVVETSAKSVALKAVGAAKKALDSHSPSRVFMEIGRFVDEGFAIGLRDYAGLAEEEASNMAVGSVSAVQDAISQLSGLLDGSIDVNPVITPTLDLSQVNARSAALANMFNGRQVAVQAQADEQQSAMINQLGNILAEQNAEPKSVIFNQTNNSPKALSTGEIYRQTRNGFSRLVSAVT